MEMVAEATMELGALHKAPLKLEKSETLASWPESQEGMGPCHSRFSPAQSQGLGMSTPHQGWAHFMSWGPCTWKSTRDSVVGLAKRGSETEFHCRKH